MFSLTMNLWSIMLLRTKTPSRTFISMEFPMQKKDQPPRPEGTYALWDWRNLELVHRQVYMQHVLLDLKVSPEKIHKYDIPSSIHINSFLSAIFHLCFQTNGMRFNLIRITHVSVLPYQRCTVLLAVTILVIYFSLTAWHPQTNHNSYSTGYTWEWHVWICMHTLQASWA